MEEVQHENHITVVELVQPSKSSVFFVPLDTHSEEPACVNGYICIFSATEKAYEYLTFYPDGQRYVKECTWEAIVTAFSQKWKRFVVDFSVFSDIYAVIEL